MQRELILDADKSVVDGLARAVESMIDEARTQSRRAIDAPAEAMHDYRRALRRAEAVLDLASPMLRKVPRAWLGQSIGRARRRTRVARDLDAVLPVIDKLEALSLLDAGDSSLAAVRAWLEACRSELASDEIVAWRLRKNARSLAGLGDIFHAALHAWVDMEVVIESLRGTYRAARSAFKAAAKSQKDRDVHAFRRAVRRLRYQLELLASAKPSAGAVDGAGNPVPEPWWLAQVRDLHVTMKALARELGDLTDLFALRAIVDEAEGDGVGFDPERLGAVLSELSDGRLERIMVDAARAFATPAKQVLVAASEADKAAAEANDEASVAKPPIGEHARRAIELLLMCGIGAFAAAGACGSDDDSPLAPVESAIAAARDNDPGALAELCDPEGNADSDARRVCQARPEEAREWALFRAWFAEARIVGLATMTTTSEHEMNIAVAMGPDERHVDVTVVKRGARWYLLRF